MNNERGRTWSTGKSVDVARSAEDAFRIFVTEIGSWWPVKEHSRAKDAQGERTVRVDLEPRIGGRIYETLNTGETRSEEHTLNSSHW